MRFGPPSLRSLFGLSSSGRALRKEAQLPLRLRPEPFHQPLPLRRLMLLLRLSDLDMPDAEVLPERMLSWLARGRR